MEDRAEVVKKLWLTIHVSLSMGNYIKTVEGYFTLFLESTSPFKTYKNT